MRIRYFSKLYLPLTLLVCLTIVGVGGFMLIEHYTLIEAFYMTIITIATVGFGEVHPLSDGGKIFTAFLIMTSFGTFAYAITSISKYIIDGEFREYFKNSKMIASIEKLENHVII